MKTCIKPGILSLRVLVSSLVHISPVTLWIIANSAYCNPTDDVLNDNVIVKTLKAGELSPADLAATYFSFPDKTESSTTHVADGTAWLVI